MQINDDKSMAFGLGFLALVAAPLSAMAVNTVVIQNGETHYIGQSGATQDGGNGNALWDIRAGGTLCITNSPGSTIWNPVVATNGAATVDATDATTLVFERGIRCGEMGELTIKTGTKHAVTFGRDIHAVADLRGLQVANADGTKDASARVLFQHSQCVVHTPTNVAWAISANEASGHESDIHFYGPRVVTEANAEIVVGGNARLAVGSAASIGADQSVKVLGNGVLSVRPFSASVSELNVAAYSYDEPPLTAGFSVNLANSKSVLRLQNVENWTGSVTGLGSVEVLSPGAGVGVDVANAVKVGEGATLTVKEGVRLSSVQVVGENARIVALAGAVVEALVAPAGFRTAVEVRTGARVTVDGASNDVEVSNLGGTVLFSDGGQGWKKEVSYWFDPSHTESLRYVGYSASAEEYRHPDAAVDGFPIFEQVLDWRNPSSDYCLFNVRTYATDHHFGVGLYPTLEPYGASETLKFLSFVRGGSARRLPIGKPNDTSANYSIAPKMVIMVFGSQSGGGNAVIGTTDGAFVRTGKTVRDGITTNTSHAIWVDGARLENPAAANTLSGGWQILAIDTDGLSVNGFGWVKEYSSSGGQNYAEILVFMDEVSELTRLQAEIYLADKWGLSYPEASRARRRELLQLAQTNAVFFTDMGNYAFSNGTVVASGSLSGSVTLENVRLEVGGQAVPTAGDVPLVGMVGWFDPDDRASLHLYGDFGYPDVDDPLRGATGVRALTDRRDNGFADGKLMLGGVSARMPFAKAMSRDGGPVRTWIDFANASPEDGNGNNLRVTRYSEGMNFQNFNSADVVPLQTLTGFVVSDSCRGGGSPVVTAVNDPFGSDICTRSVTASAADPIWSDSTSDKLKNGIVRLNGEVVRYQDGFTGGGEVLTFQPTSAANVGVMGNYSTGQAVGGGTSFEWLGEMLFYSTALGEADMRTVEAYLMHKWFGRTLYGYHDLNAMTVFGSGRIVSPDAASLPMIDSAFRGVVEVTASAVFEIVIDPASDTVTGGLSCLNAMLDLPEEVSLNVHFTVRPRRGRGNRVWSLLDCAGTARPVAWNLHLEDANLPSGFELLSDGGAVRLVLPPRGITIIIQ